MFILVLTRKTAKSRKKPVGGSGDCRANNAPSVASTQPKPERSPQPELLARVKRVSDMTLQQSFPNRLNKFHFYIMLFSFRVTVV